MQEKREQERKHARESATARSGANSRKTYAEDTSDVKVCKREGIQEGKHVREEACKERRHER